MSGPNESLPVSYEQRLEKVDAGLDDFETSVGLPPLRYGKASEEAQRVMSLEPEVLRTMNAEQCGEAAVVLYQFAWHLQRCLNREQGKVRWAEETLKRIIGPKLRNVTTSYASFEERKILATRNDEAALQVDNIRVKHQCRIDRISYMATRVENIAKALLDLQQTKRRQQNSNV